MQEVAAMMATSGEEFVLYALASIVVMTVIIVDRMIGLLFRAADRSARNLRRTLNSASRSIFGPGGRPGEIARRLRERYPTLSPGRGTGLTFTCSGRPGRLDFISDLTEVRFELD